MEKDGNNESQRVIRVYIGDNKIDIKNIREIVTEPGDGSAAGR